jgi:hypothetical protein
MRSLDARDVVAALGAMLMGYGLMRYDQALAYIITGAALLSVAILTAYFSRGGRR